MSSERGFSPAPLVDDRGGVGGDGEGAAGASCASSAGSFLEALLGAYRDLRQLQGAGQRGSGRQ